jgi:hypothetical protein
VVELVILTVLKLLIMATVLFSHTCYVVEFSPEVDLSDLYILDTPYAEHQ